MALRDDHLQDAASSLLEAVKALSPEARDRFMQELIEASMDAESTGDRTRLTRALTSISVCRDVHGSSRYEAARAAALREEVGAETKIADLAEYTGRLREAAKRAGG